MEAPAQPRKRMSAATRRASIEDAATVLFAEHGYQGASIGAIARRSGVTPPVLYDHFASKQELYRRLLERHFAELRQVWRENFVGEDPPGQRVARSFDAWFAYIESHPFAGRMLFRDTTGDPQIEAMHQEVAASSRAAIMGLFAAQPDVERVIGPEVEEGLEMAWIVMRGVLQGLAMWWYDHPRVPRERVVATAMNALWVGWERTQAGEAWG
jgi:AcrR family transcriptional regulator